MRLGFGSVSGPFDFFCGSYLIQYGLSHAIEEWIVGDGHISGPINISLRINLVFVYNANSSFTNSILDIGHKVINPRT